MLAFQLNINTSVVFVNGGKHILENTALSTINITNNRRKILSAVRSDL